MLKQIQNRRSCREFTADKVEKEKIEQLLKAALWAPTSKDNRPWEFIVVQEKATLEKLSRTKPQGAAFLANAPLGIVVLGDPEKSDVWVEDCSIASILIQMTGESLGLGSTWIQIRKRMFDEQTSASKKVREILNIPSGLEVLSIMALGYKAEERPPYNEDILLWERIHYEKM